MVRDRSAKPLCSGSIPLDSFKAVQKDGLFFPERLGKAGSVYIATVKARFARGLDSFLLRCELNCRASILGLPARAASFILHLQS